MKKVAIYCLQLLAFVGIASLTSCGTSDPVTPQGTPTITAVADPSAGYKLGTGETRYKFEKGDKIKVKITASVPGGVQIFQVRKGTSTTDITYTPAIAPGATSISQVIEIPVTETFDAVNANNNIITVNFNVKNSQATSFTTAKFEYQVVAQGQGGGGGTLLLLRATATVNLGAQTSTLPSYAASQALTTGSTGGLYLTNAIAALNQSQKRAIDLTFGVVGTDGNSAAGANATTPQLISPDTRESKLFNNPMGTDATATTFKVTTLTAANLTGASSIVTATSLSNNIDHSTGSTKFITIANNTVYSFVNAQGAKGYILVGTISGTNDAREVPITVVVQQLQ